MASSTLKGALNWSNYQDSQLRVLMSLERAFSTSLSIGKSVEGSLGSLQSSMETLVSAANALAVYASGLSANSGGGGRPGSNINDTQDEVSKMLNSLHQAEMKRLEERHKTSSKALENQLKASQEELDRIKQNKQDRSELKATASNILSRIISLFAAWGKIADEYSMISNDLLKATGESADAVSDFREEIVRGITASLNSDTGGLYNAREVYKQMVAIANANSIGNLDTLREITRPIMLAQESTNLNLGNLSSLLSRWSTRYNFSSLNMESLVDSIVKNTAGKNVSDEQLLENLNTLENWIVYNTHGDTDLMTQYSESLIAGSAWAESLGIDSKRLTDYVAKITSGQAFSDKSILALLEYGGSDINSAYDLATSGRYEELYYLLAQSEAALFRDTMNDATVKQQIADVFGLDINNLLDSYNAMYNSTSDYTVLDEFLNSVEDTSAAEVAEDKYVSFLDQLEQKLEAIYEQLADWQEQLGIGLSDIAKILAAVAGAVGILSIIKSIGNVLGLSGSIVSGAGSIGAGTLLGAAGAIALALAIGGTIYSVLNEILEENRQHTQELIDTMGGGMAEDELMMMVNSGPTVDANGHVSTSYEMIPVKIDDYDYEASRTNILENAQQQLHEAIPIAEGMSDWDLVSRYILGMNTHYNWGEETSRWVDNVPVLGWAAGIAQTIGTLSTAVTDYSMNTKINEFMNTLTDDDRRLFTAYYNAGLIANQSTLEFLLDNWDAIVDLHDKGLAVELNANGLNNPVNSKGLIGYATGTNYINQDQIAILHEGEAVVPKRYNPAANMNELERLRDESQEIQNKELEYSKKSQEYLQESTEVLTEIKKFLSKWKEDNTQQQKSAKTQANLTSSKNSFISNYGY